MCDHHHTVRFDEDKAYEDQLISALHASPKHPLSAPEAPRRPSVYVLFCRSVLLRRKGEGPAFPLESTEGSFPAPCREFVIPAEAGIQKARLDSPVSSTGQACQARNDGPV